MNRERDCVGEEENMIKDNSVKKKKKNQTCSSLQLMVWDSLSQVVSPFRISPLKCPKNMGIGQKMGYGWTPRITMECGL